MLRVFLFRIRNVFRVVTDWNENATQMLGWKEEEWIGRSITDLVQIIISRSSCQEVIERITKCGSYDGEVACRHQDGHEIIAHVHADVITNQKGENKGTLFSIHDITDRKRVEEELHKSEERFRNIFSNNMIPMAILAKTGKMIDANDALLALVGYTREELKSNLIDWVEVTPSEYAPRDLFAIAEIYRKGYCTPYEKSIRHKDGHLIPILIGGGKFDGQSGIGISFVIDLTDRKRTEQALFKSEERHAFLLRFSDAIRSLADAGEIQQTASRVLREHLGCDCVVYWEAVSEDEVIPIAVDCAPGAFRLSTVQQLDNYGTNLLADMRCGRVISMDHPSRNPELTAEQRETYARINAGGCACAPFVKNGRLIAFITTIFSETHAWTDYELSLLEDVAERTWAATERARTEEALRNSEAGQGFLLRFGDALRSITNETEILQMSSRLTGEYLKADRAFFSELCEGEDRGIVHPDYRRGDLPSLTGLYSTSDFPEAMDVLISGLPYVINDVANSKQLPESIRMEYLSLGYASLFCVPLFKKGRLVLCLSVISGKPFNWTAEQIQFAQEIAERTWVLVERARAEQALRESEEKANDLVRELEDADRNKNQFISTLSHELRNPLAVISAGLEILDVSCDEEQTRRTRDIMRRQMNQLCALVDDLLDLTRITHNRIELKKERIELNELISSVSDDQQALFEDKGIRFITMIRDHPIYLDADPVRLKQIVGNLLHNAQKYARPGGETVLSVYRDKTEAVISVIDNGIGLDPELIPYLFTPFVQADMSLDRGGGGVGLGLSITKGIVELHGGTVNAASEGLGKGSAFTIRLPFAES